MFFKRLKASGLGQNSYMLGCGQGIAMIIDPRRDVEEYLELAQNNGLSIAYILETHRQEDFEFGSRMLAKATGAQIVTGSHELFGQSDIKLENGQELKAGTTRLVAFETPGHTPESMPMRSTRRAPERNAGGFLPEIRSLSVRQDERICLTLRKHGRMPGFFTTPFLRRSCRSAIRR